MIIDLKIVLINLAVTISEDVHVSELVTVSISTHELQISPDLDSKMRIFVNYIFDLMLQDQKLGRLKDFN